MKQQIETPKYATVLYDVRKKLGISWNEYIYLDMIQKLHINQAWCTKSLLSCAIDLGITKRGVSKMKERLVTLGLLEKNAKGHLRVTSKYTEVAVNSVPQFVKRSVNSVPKSVNSVPLVGELSSTKNNNRITKNRENENYEASDDYKKARQASEKIKIFLLQRKSGASTSS